MPSTFFNIFFNFFGIDNAAVAQGDPRLLGKKLAVLVGDFQLFNSAFVAVIHKRSDRVRVVLADLDKPCELVFIVVNIDNRLEPAHADTARDGNVGGDIGVKKRFSDFFRAGGNAAGALTDNDPHCAASLNSFKIFFVLSGVKLP